MFILDISDHNTINNWTALATDTPAVWVKATQAAGQALGYVSPSFAGPRQHQFTSAKAAGMLTGAYHFGDARFAGAVEFDHFESVAGPAGAFKDGALLPMLDIENTAGSAWNGNTVNAYVEQFIARYRLRTGQRKIIVYASRSFWETIMNPNRWADADVYLMVAAYPGAVDWSHGLNQSGYSHPRLAVWQYTDVAPASGSAGLLDRSRQVAFSQADLTLGSLAPIEGDDEMAAPPVLFLAAGNGNEPALFPHGVWRNEFGVYVGLESDDEANNLLAAWPGSPKDGSGRGVWVKQDTLAEWVRISRVGVPPVTAAKA